MVRVRCRLDGRCRTSRNESGLEQVEPCKGGRRHSVFAPHGRPLPPGALDPLQSPRGAAFTRANVKDFGYGDLRDILAGVDAVLKSAPIDPQRTGIEGWSYGGYMTMWALLRRIRVRRSTGLRAQLTHHVHQERPGSDPDCCR